MENTFDELDKMIDPTEETVEQEYEYDDKEIVLTKEEGDALSAMLISVAQELTLLRDSISKVQNNMSTLVSTESVVDLVFAKIQESRKAYVRSATKLAPGRPVRTPTKTKVPKVKKAIPVKKAKPKKVVKKKKAVKKAKPKNTVKSKSSTKTCKSKKR